MNNLMVFEGNNVEIFEFKGKVLFNPRHVGECLDLTDSAVRKATLEMNSKQVIKLTNSDVNSSNIRKLNNAGENFLTESGVYKLIFKSRKESAERFQDWVTDEVLPSIRSTGTYSSNKTSTDNIEKLKIAYQNVSLIKEYLDNSNIDSNTKLLTIKQIYKEAGVDLPIETHNNHLVFDEDIDASDPRMKIVSIRINKQIWDEFNIFAKKHKPCKKQTLLAQAFVEFMNNHQ